MKLFLAQAISRILAPSNWLVVVFVLFFFRTGLNKDQIRILFPTLFVFQAFIPGLYFFYELFQKKIQDVDITNRKERYGLFSLAFLARLFGLGAIAYYGTFEALKVELALVLVFAVIVLVTFLWKISVHTAGNTAGMILLNYYFVWKFWPVFLLLPFITWSRIVLKKHTPAQLLVGTGAGALALLPLWLL